MKNKLFSQAYASLFQNTGDPTLRSSAELRVMQENCMVRNDPNTFYATVDPRPEPKVVWSCNTRNHLGAQTITYPRFFSAIHPFWLPIYVGISESTYRLVQGTVTDNGSRDLSVTANVPLRNQSGKYYWYHQVSYAGTFDARGGLVEYFCEFHRLAEFDRMVPAGVAFTYHGNAVEAFDTELKENVGKVLNKLLRELLSPTSFKLLRAYRILQSQGLDTSRENVARHLGVRVQALDKGKVRLLDQARLAFPAALLVSVTIFADFLNDTFGHPQRIRSRSGA